MARCVYNRNAKEHKIQSQFFYFFVGYVDKRGKKRKREKKKTESGDD